MSYYYEKRIQEERARAMVTYACTYFKQKNISFEWDDRPLYKCWIIETPIGWRDCNNGQELCAVVAELKEYFKAQEAA